MSLIHKALFSAYKEIKNPIKNAKNPFLKNSYADLGAVIEEVKDKLEKHGIMVMQECKLNATGDVMSVETHFIYCDKNIMGAQAETVTVTVEVRMKELTPQGSMGAFTYGRRYGLLSAFSLAAEDDDGNVASGKDDAKLISTEETKSGIQSLLGKAKAK